MISIDRLKEMAIEELETELNKAFEEKDKLHLIIDRLLEASGYDTNTASAEDFEDVYENMRYEKQQLDQLKQTLTEIKEIAKPYQRDIHKICGYCRKYDSCHACCIDDLKLYEYRTGTTKACERFVELERFNINIVANLILQKISECEGSDVRS